jgi:serine/threonine protein kinase
VVGVAGGLSARGEPLPWHAVRRAQQLGRYHLLDRIAFGGMAEIYRAKTFDAHGHAHLVAVKRVLAHLAEDDDFIQMLVDEAKIASVLRHGSIARVYEFARAQGEYFIAMEHVDGKDARTILERCRQKKKPMPPEHAAYVAAEVASALHAAHTAVDARRRPLRIVHRDVSPSNIIVAYTGEVKLCDFGIAKATLSKVNTKTGVIKGKVKYMSPEQALGRKLDHRSDVFSLGSCLYEMLTRVPPFTAGNEMDLLIKVRDAKYRPVSELVPSTPPEIEAIADKCLTRSRAQRYQTAAEVEADLRAFLRRYAPTYSRSHLGRYVRKAFATEIERELRMLEEYVLADEVSDDVGENLIAGRAQSEPDFAPVPVPFQPRPTGTHAAAPEADDFADGESHTTLPRSDSEGLRAATDVPDLHAAQTMILDPSRRAGRTSQPPPVPPGRPTGRAMPPPVPPPRARTPSRPAPTPDLDWGDELHREETMILDRARLRRR